MLQRLGWFDVYRNLGDSVLALFKAEAQLILNDSKRWLFHAARIAGMVVVALIILAYLPFLLLLTLVDGLSSMLGWSTWLSSLVVLVGIVLTIAAVFAGVYFWSRKTMLEDHPVAVVQRRLDDHRGWWRHQVTIELESEATAGAEPPDALDDAQEEPLPA